jgi:C4-dicarboxylate-specific signal transduction histidine kinase
LAAWVAQTETNLMIARPSHLDEVYATRAQSTRIARLTMMAELAASIAYEISDPLCAVVVNAEACLRWLNRDEPDLDEARDAVSSIASEGIRAGEMIRRLQALLMDSDEQQGGA